MRRIVCIGNNYAQYKEADAEGVITPGNLMQRTGTGGVVRHSTASQKVQPLRVAVENDIFGKGIDDNYAIGDRVIYMDLDTGCEFIGLVAAGKPAIAIQDLVESDGAGGVQKTVTLANAIGRATEALDQSAAGSAARLRVVVL